MAHITRRKRPLTRHPLSQGVGLGTALLTGLMASTTYAADAAGNASQAATLQEVSVQAPGVSDYKTDSLSSTKFTQPIAETPRTVEVINQGLIQDQHATTLTEALKNSPGVGVFYAGENGNTSTGDEVYMRGFDASGSIFVDGVRDIGSISRDMFNTDQVEVIKGPSGADYGRTSPSGSINLVTKQPYLANSVGGSLSVGTDDQKRATADFNRKISDGTAVRLNLMGQDSDVPGRDNIEHDRWGIAPSIAFGLDGDTRVYLNYLHVTQNNVPDGGVSTVGLPGYTSPDPTRPQLANAAKVDTENFYGTDADHDDVDVDMFTSIIEHDLGNGDLLRNTTRWGRTHQDYLLSSFMASAAYFNTPDINDPSTWTIRRMPNYQNQTNTILTNQLGLIQHAQTGSVKHTFSYGLELTREKVETWGMAADGNYPDTVNLYDPQSNTAAFASNKTGAKGKGTTDTAAAYLFDTMEIGQYWQLTAGMRVDHYNTDYESSAACGGRGPACGANPSGTIVPDVDTTISDNLFGWQVGALYKATSWLNLYADYAVSAQPPGGDKLQLSSRANNANNAAFNPQKAHTAEVGAKWKLAGNRLLLTSALYRTVVEDQVEQNPDGTYSQTGKKQVQGVELSAVGNITPDWNVSAGFTIMDATVESGDTITEDGSDQLTYTPKHAFTSWTTYRLPFDLTIGAGARYVGGLKRGSDGAVGTPDHTDGYWVADAMASYPISKDIDVQLNVYNVFDKDYVASINKSGYRYNPGLPRSAMLTLNMRY